VFRQVWLANCVALAVCPSLLSPEAAHSIFNAQNYPASSS
jgi:hypothetical protein